MKIFKNILLGTGLGILLCLGVAYFGAILAGEL